MKIDRRGRLTAIAIIAIMVSFSPLLNRFGSALRWVGVQFLYREAPAPEGGIIHDIPYGKDPRHRLDLFLPKGRGWPVLMFVHGGGWTTGDKNLIAGGHDVYGNIGRFFAAAGIGTAIINYRLLPAVSWPDQIDDVARAVAWVKAHISNYGGDPGRMFLSGHSAGAQLVTRAALDPESLARHSLSPAALRGIVAVSGAGYDMEDEKTYAAGADPSYYEERFGRGLADDSWKRDASPLRFVSKDAPPFLIIYATGESRALQRQSSLLHDALTAAGAESTLAVVPGEDHERMVLALSRKDKAAARAALDFILAQ